MVGGLLPYDFFCEDDPEINLFVFTAGADSEGKPEQMLWGFARLERFEAMLETFANPKAHGWQQSVSVLTGPAHNGTRSLKFQAVSKIVKHEVNRAEAKRAAEYEIHTEDGERYFTWRTASAQTVSQRVIYSAKA